MPILNALPSASRMLPPVSMLVTSHSCARRLLACALLALATLLSNPLHAAPVQNATTPPPEEATRAVDQKNAELNELATEPIEPPADLSRWLDEVETLCEQGDLDGARQHLSGLIASEVYVALLTGEDAAALAGLHSIVTSAKDISLLDVEGVAREERVRRLSASLEPDHPDVLRANEGLAVTRYALGDLAGAVELFELVHTARERLLPPDHPDLLSAIQNLSVMRYTLGDLTGSLKLDELVHAARERSLPPDHPNLLLAKQNLAVTRKALGDLAGAAKLFEFVHAARERLLPPDHPDLLIAKQNLAGTHRALGDLSGALELEEFVHATWERLRPPGHPDLLSAKQNLAGTRYALGDLAGAAKLYEFVHAARERLLPPDHPDLLRAKGNLAATRKQLGNLEGALELEEFVHAAWERLLPPDHPDLLSAKLNLAGTRKALGDFVGALELDEFVHAAWERLRPPNHPDLLRAKGNLATSRRTVGDLAGALELEEIVHAAWERMLPPDHPDLLRAKLNLAGTRQALGDLAGAAALQEFVHAAWERLLPPEHRDLLAAKLNLAGTRQALGDLAGALELFEVVHAARERLLPPDHPDLLRAKGNLATSRSALGNLAGAAELFELVHAAWERLLPPEHRDLLASKLNLAGTRKALGDFEGAAMLEEFVHAAWEQLLPSEHPDLLHAKQNLAVTLRALGNLEGALKLEELVHAATERSLSPDHPTLLSAKQGLAATRYALGDLTGAAELTASILQGQVVRARGLRHDAPRVARASAGSELHRFSACLFLGESGESKFESNVLPRLDPALFSTLESLRSVSIGSPTVMGLATRRPELAPLLAERRRVRSALGDLQLAVPGVAADASEVDAWRTQLVQLSEQRDGLERAMRRKLAEAGFDEALPTAAGVAARLGANTLLVDFLRYDRIGARDAETGQRAPTVNSLLAFVVTPAGEVYRVELGPSSEIERMVAEWNERIGRTSGRGVGVFAKGGSDIEAAIQLRERLLDPCLAVVGGKLPTALHVILDDFLYLAPVDALMWKDGKRLGEACAVHIEVTAQRLTTNAAPYSGNGILLALGGVDFSAKDVEVPQELLTSATPPMGDSYRSSSSRPGRFGELEQSRIEVEALEFMFGELTEGESVVLIGADASKKALFEHAPSARYLHLATHGWFASETFQSTRDSQREGGGELIASFGRAEETLRGFAPETLCGLALAGANQGLNSIGKVPGILTAEELSALDLSNCELAVLSACETNVGLRRAGQGIQSLQTALHAAGVRTAITTLWRVDDAAARRLMELFYTKLWQDKLPKAKALWQAKMELRAEGYAVKDWAGWVMTGDPR